MSITASATVTVTGENFASILSSCKPVIVDFWAPWCPPCRLLTPFFEKFAREYGDRALFVKVNRDEAPILRTLYSVDTIPLFITFDAGAMDQVDDIGFSDYQTFRKRIMRMLGLPILGRPNNRERQFRKLVDDAYIAFDDSVKEARDLLLAEHSPLQMQARRDFQTNDAALRAGSITEDEHIASKETIQKKLKTAQASLQPIVDAYLAVAAPAEATYIEAITAATNALFPLPAEKHASTQKASMQATGHEDVAFCALGDETCAV